MTESLRAVLESFGNVAVLRLRGPLVFGENLKDMQDIVTRLRNEGHDCLVVDLTEVELTDSSGISALLDVRQTIGEKLILLRPSDRLRNALTVARVASLFQVVDDEPQLWGRIGCLRDDVSGQRGR